MTVVITWSPPSTNLSPYGIPIKSPPPRLSVAAGVAERASFRRKRPSGELQGPSGVSNALLELHGRSVAVYGRFRRPAISGPVNGGGKVGHVGGLIVGLRQPGGTFCRRP